MPTIMINNIENIVVVGGGTAGWLSAAYLNRALNKGGESPCNITLIESSDINTIGVGESTLPRFGQTISFLGFDENEWMVGCNATFKLANKFVGWSGIPGQEILWHPFGALPSVNGVELPYHWLKRKLQGRAEPFDASCYRAVHLCRAKKSPKLLDDLPYKGQVRYAYHLDAGLLTTFLKEKATTRGVKHVVDNVVKVVLAENGFISHLKTEKSGPLFGDLFIDCSGFRGLLINQALQEPFISFSDCLFCDRAIAMPTPLEDNPYDLNPYSTATALNAGWAWHAPLFDRNGNGYAYSSAFIGPEAAEQELRVHLGEVANKTEARHIKMRIGRTRNAWVNNCVSIGLSSGFVEPLEATGIGMIEVGLRDLVRYLPDNSFQPALMKTYNQLIQHYYEHIRDFLTLHYCLTRREDTPFWRANKNNPAIPDTLKDRLEMWQVMPPVQEHLSSPPGGFGPASYLGLLANMERLPQQSLPILDYVDESDADQTFLAIKEEAVHLSDTLPNHYEHLRWLRLYNTLRQAYQEDIKQ